MLKDIWTISTKDIKEFLFSRGNKYSGWISVLVVIGIIGVYLPLTDKENWLTSSIDILSWIWMPVFMVISLVTDSIAGERERHTLETLLASRVKDQAILLGKILASVLYGWGLYIISLLVAAVTVNAANGGQPWHFYPLGFFAAAAALSLLSCILICSVGVFVSLRASTARIAQQRLSLFMMALVFIPVILLQFLPKSSLSVIEFALDALNLQKVMWIIGIILVALDFIFIFAALARFKRTRLILE